MTQIFLSVQTKNTVCMHLSNERIRLVEKPMYYDENVLSVKCLRHEIADERIWGNAYRYRSCITVLANETLYSWGQVTQRKTSFQRVVSLVFVEACYAQIEG